MSHNNERAQHLKEVERTQPVRNRELPLRPLKGGDPRDEEPTLGDLVWTIVDNRALIASVAAIVVILAAAYVFLVSPTYRSDVLLQVEDKSKSVAGLDDLSSMFSDKTPAEAEIEIIRSRTLVGAVVDQLNLTIAVRPRTFPLLGGAFFRRYEGEGVASPVLGLRGFAWGGERARVQRLEVPEKLYDDTLHLVTAGNGRFRLLDTKGDLIVEGEVGKPASSLDPARRSEVFVSELQARPGTEFLVVKRRRDAVVDDLQHELKIGEKGKKTGIIAVSLEGKDARNVAAILDAVAQNYQRQNVERKSAEAANTLAFLQTQLPLLKKNLDAAESAFNVYQRKNGSVDLPQETQALLERAVEIEKALVELDLQRTELSQRYTETHPALLALRQKADKLRAERSAMNAKMRGLPEQELDSARLTRDVKVATELYFLLINRAQELQVVKSGTIGNVRILDVALQPFEPASPRKGLVLAISLLLGLGAGVGITLVRKAMDHGVDDPEEIEATTGLSLYASVPHSNREAELCQLHGKGRLQALARADPTDLAIESLRSLRTSLQFALSEAANNVITIGGPSPGVGKSFLSVNLAHVLASSGKRVLLVDADLRRGRLHRYFDGERVPGLSDAVAGQVLFADAVRKTENEMLDFIGTGTLPPNPSELLASGRFEDLLDEASRRYDLVLVDVPPILAVTDGALVARHAGVNLLVLRAGRHPMREIALALKHLSSGGVRVQGAVLNDVQSTKGGRYGRYSYHYQYEYKSESKKDA